ncbi:hypothetical protein CORC01_10243 [Colletotrichum orchidophilum]|uniref:Uncharacterized protein n=1 Tax=Colletotrichum orchidophilum TaxID=1209926 RepID=A0A1G4AZ50_9PEZI|nr:uncharacterized protein CORC01_10243 [Colletotrichum orchidophilum]OHE94424.1 hypothetical protein CORC01_10243 [Colletotrichum orchidophilum]
MEEQHCGDPTPDVDAFTQNPAESTTLSSSELTLRFPRPQGNRQLASWISSSEPDIMTPSEAPEDTTLSESTYEFINTDDESQDGRGTEAESLSSFDYARPDDVHSLAGTEHTEDMANHSDTDSEDSEDAAQDRSRASSIQYAEQSLLNPSSRVATPPLGVDGSMDIGQHTPLVQSIEFDETQDPVYFKQVSVKHTIHSFTEEHSTSIAKTLKFEDQSKRLIAAVRQTMAPHCLATKEPLRIMYTGSHAARHDIIYKISSAFTASASADGCGISEDAGIYNVVPISSLGSPKVPEVELMKTSQYQIKVENCTSAKEVVYHGERFPGETVYQINVDGDRTYQSAFAPSCSIIEPSWTLPHVAIFYVTESDDEAVRNTRNAAWHFMQRHTVPCVFISNDEVFRQPTAMWDNMVNQHAIHICVESSDRAMPSVKLPIDLTSFLNIDARQMNRNLAYLTGLYENADGNRESESIFVNPSKTVRRLWHRAVEATEDIDLWVVGQTAILIFSVVATALLSNYFLAGSSTPALSTVSSTTVSPSPTVSMTSTVLSTSTSTINLSTTTIRVAQKASLTPGNTAVAPFAELADFLADRFPDKAYVCSAEKISRNEILIKIPSGTKMSWLAKDSITIDVLKGERSVKTRFSSTDEGILIEIPKSEAYGILTIAVNTTRKPKVNETFVIDFGKTFLEYYLGYGKAIASHILDTASTVAHRAEERAFNLSSSLDSVVLDVRGLSTRLTARVAIAANAIFKGSTELSENLQSLRKPHRLQELKDRADMVLTKAQIQSKLLALKVLQRTEEHQVYLDKAKRHMEKLRLTASEAHKQRLDKEKKEMRARRKRERLAARCQTGTGFSRWTQQCRQQG